MFKNTLSLFLFIGIFLFSQLEHQNENKTFDPEKIIIERISYHTTKINLIVSTFSKFFTDNKNIDLLKYAVCKYILPRFLYTNALQLLAHQLILNLKEKCPECVLGFYGKLEETPQEFQWAAKIFEFAPRFADYKLKIQAFQTLLHTFDFYANDILNIVIENNYQKLMDYISLIEEELIGIYAETYISWDQNTKNCTFDFLEKMDFNKCIKDKEIPKIDKGDKNCGCDNRTPLSTYEYYNTIPIYPLDLIFSPKVRYAGLLPYYCTKALNFTYTFKNHLEQNYPHLYKLLSIALESNENTIYELCKASCKNLETAGFTEGRQMVSACERIGNKEQCNKKGCSWCEVSRSCRLFEEHCTKPIECKHVQQLLNSKIEEFPVQDHFKHFTPLKSGKEFRAEILCLHPFGIIVLSKEETLQLCKKFNSVYMDASSIHKIGEQDIILSTQPEYHNYFKQYSHYLYDICKCFDKNEIDSAKDIDSIPQCKPLKLLPKE